LYYQNLKYMLLSILLFIASIGILYIGAEMLVKGSSSLALKLGLSSLVVGLTVVAFGTSAPELVISIRSALGGIGNIAIGNVVGSNIINMSLIVGLAAMTRPLTVQSQSLRIDMPVMIAMLFLFIVFFIDHTISRLEAITFFLLLVGYTWWQIYYSKKESKRVTHEFESAIKQEPPKGKMYIDLMLILLGLGALVGGSDLMVYSAVNIAKTMGMSEALIGLTIIAAGTSMPELATSVVASIKKKPDIAIGNIIGSSIFNILAILGISGTITPLVAHGIGYRDTLIMVGVSMLLLLFLITKNRLSRMEGFILFIIYIAYLEILLHSQS
jgi:cation:H+ antiporter